MVSVDYRMAPEHRAPVAVEDCVDATTWVGVSGDVLRADTSRMAVGGDSAGGNLAAVVAQVLRDHGDHRLRHQALIYPATDMTSRPPRSREHANAAILTKRSMDAFRDHYVPAGHDLRDPLLSPLLRPARRAAAGAGPDRRPRPDPRRRHPLRRTRCAMPGCRCGSRTTSGCPTASPRCRVRRRRWGASTGGSWPAS